MSTDTPPDVDADETIGASVGADDDEQAILEVENLHKYFQEDEGFLDRLVGEVNQVRAVDGVNLSIRKGETLAIVGESGCGKSTLGQTILNLHKPTDGTIRFQGEDITGLSRDDMRPYRRDMQIIFQDPLASLNPRQTVGQIIKAPLEVHNIGDSDQERVERAEQLLERVGLKASHYDRYPHQFSGGQQQRIGVARALSLEPELIIADEPVSALDVSVQAQVLNLLDGLQDEMDLAMMFIAHDLSVVRHISDRVAVMYLGEIVEVAPTDELFENPQHPYTKSLLSAVPRINPADRGQRVILEGTVPSPLDPPGGCRFHTRCPVVIPPDDWTGDQAAFKSAFTFRNRLLSGELDPDAIRERLESTQGTTDDETIADRLIQTTVPGDFESLPQHARDTIESATESLIAGEEPTAREMVEDAFQSPCERNPDTTHVGDGHVTTCHRVDETTEWPPIWPEDT